MWSCKVVRLWRCSPVILMSFCPFVLLTSCPEDNISRKIVDPVRVISNSRDASASKKMQYFPLGFCLFECFSFGFWLFPMTINLLWKVFHNFLWIIPIWSNLLQCYLLFEGSIIYRCTTETFPRKTLEMVKVQTCAAGNMFWWVMKGAVMLEILV